MTRTEISSSPRPGRVVATVAQDGTRLGHVNHKGTHFEAIRKTGTADDIRRVARGFRSIEAAAAWIAKSAA